MQKTALVILAAATVGLLATCSGGRNGNNAANNAANSKGSENFLNQGNAMNKGSNSMNGSGSGSEHVLKQATSGSQ